MKHRVIVVFKNSIKAFKQITGVNTHQGMIGNISLAGRGQVSDRQRSDWVILQGAAF